MGKFVAGMIFAGICAFVAVYIYLHFGFMNLAADQPISQVERFFVGGMMDKWSERNAPKQANPVQPTDQNLVEAVHIYKNNCAVCHGSPNNPTSDLAQSMYPRVPQFMRHPPSDMSEPQIYFITKNGVRETGMPAWGKVLNEQQMWSLAALLKNLEKLPPAVEAEWRATPQNFVPYPNAPSVFPGQGQTPTPPQVQQQEQQPGQHGPQINPPGEKQPNKGGHNHDED